MIARISRLSFCDCDVIFSLKLRNIMIYSDRTNRPSVTTKARTKVVHKNVSQGCN